MFGERLKALRKEFGLTQAELADIIGVERSSIGKYEGNNKIIPSDSVKQRIAEYFHVSVDYLLGLSDSRSASSSDSDLKFALWGGDADTITDAQLDEVRRFARFIAERDKEKK